MPFGSVSAPWTNGRGGTDPHSISEAYVIKRRELAPRQQFWRAMGWHSRWPNVGKALAGDSERLALERGVSARKFHLLILGTNFNENGV